MTRAFRAYLSELEQEGKHSLGFLSAGMLLLGCAHPLLLLLILPSVLVSWLSLYRECRVQFLGTLYRRGLLGRMLRFEDYDPDFFDAMELDRQDGAPRPRPSRLESLWRSYEASCRNLMVDPLRGTRHFNWMLLPLLTVSVGLVGLPALRHGWNWLPLQPGMKEGFASSVVFIVGWLLGLGAATLGRYVIQMALVNAAWEAVLRLPAEEEEEQGESGVRDRIISWRVTEEDQPAEAMPEHRAGV